MTKEEILEKIRTLNPMSIEMSKLIKELKIILNKEYEQSI